MYIKLILIISFSTLGGTCMGPIQGFPRGRRPLGGAGLQRDPEGPE